MTARTRHWQPLAVQMALALLGCASVFATNAQAGCGDYVQILNTSEHATTAAEPNRHPAAPCQGPICDRQNPPAAPPAPAPTQGVQHHLDAILILDTIPDSPRCTRVPPKWRATPLFVTSVIFRPPRLHIV